MQKKIITILVKLTISTLLFVFILKKVDIEHLVTIFLSLKISYFFVALMLTLCEQIIFAYMWFILLRAKGVRFSLSKIIYITFVSPFLGAFLPAGIGPELVKVQQLYKNNCRPLDSISSLFVLRVISLSSLFLMVIIGILSAPCLRFVINKTLYYTILFSSIFYFLILYLLFSKSFLQSLVKKIFKKSSFIHQKLKQLYDSIAAFRDHTKVIRVVFSLGMFVQIVRILLIYILSLALNLNISILYFIIFTPLITIVAILPISLAGIGVREGAFVYFFKFAGVSSTNAFTLSLAVFTLILCIVLIGGLIYVVNSLNIKRKTG